MAWDRQTAIDTLEDVHEFPAPYIFKVIGDNTDDFQSRVAQVPLNIVGKDVEFDLSTRESSGDKYVSVTLEVHVEKAERILDMYEILNDMDGVRLTM